MVVTRNLFWVQVEHADWLKWVHLTCVKNINKDRAQTSPLFLVLNPVLLVPGWVGAVKCIKKT